MTAPIRGAVQPQLKFAVASCQNWEAGLWTAYDHMLADNPDLVMHLGDYIYEGAAKDTGVRKHNSAEIVTLSDYRNLHALYKSDPAIQGCCKILSAAVIAPVFVPRYRTRSDGGERLFACRLKRVKLRADTADAGGC